MFMANKIFSQYELAYILEYAMAEHVWYNVENSLWITSSVEPMSAGSIDAGKSSI